MDYVLTPSEPLFPVVLNTDDSIGTLDNEQRITLSNDWREAVRFGCRRSVWAKRIAEMEALMPAFNEHGTVFMGSGDFHHLSFSLIQRCIAAGGYDMLRPVQVVILDNHPDNMRFPWGIHCGSWVQRVALLPAVAKVHVVGITSSDLGAAHAWEHRLAALCAGKLTYWSTKVDTGWAKLLGLGSFFRSFDTEDEMVQALCDTLAEGDTDTYLSVDKDAFSPEVVRTNWDQGELRTQHMQDIVQALRGRIVGSDVTGEVSVWNYTTPWKRWLSTADGQDTTQEDAELPQWQAHQTSFNQQLLQMLQAARS
ncbi:hypothetical protein E4695_08780 [Alcaligenaceae bacterium 429]|uniref:hypothetical protein n=1 Tax=Paenalcaligenes sp. Me52 TaxID=3392038 RepID=UPI0010931ADF|nr:hypothetical protein E4695_08780 [Alcaligenaceae bacterium 429]